MKILALPIVALLFLSSCVSVRVLSDYDRDANFNGYNTYAFYKTGIDKAHISDLDKKRILKAIDSELGSRGMVKSEDPDILISIFTKEQEQVDIHNNYGWGWSPWYWGGYNQVSTSTEGSLYIDLIDASKKELVWQGVGRGYLSQKMSKKEERIKEFVMSILAKYPPGAGQ